MNTKWHTCAGSLLILLFFGCNKDETTATPEPTPESTTATINLVFTNKVDAKALELDKPYLLATGDSVTFNKWNYYVSNVVLKNATGATYSVPESYFIVKQSSAASQTISVQVPFGTYTSVQFLLGVDSARNVSGSQTGGLDPVYASDMYWSWNTGYIFFKMEGTSPSSGSPQKALEYHIGGYKGTYKTQRTINLDFLGQQANVSKDGVTPKIMIDADATELFQNPTKLDLKSDYSIVSAGTRANMIANNYADMFKFKGVVQ